MTKLIGSFDELHAVRPVHHLNGRAVRSGEKAVARGWIATSEKQKIRHVFIDIGGRLQPVAYGYRRDDVASKYGVGFANVGFEGTIDIPERSGFELDVFVRCIVDGDRQVNSGSTISIAVKNIASAQTLVPQLGTARGLSRIRRVADMLQHEPSYGRSRRNVRAGALVEVSGWVLDSTGRGAGRAAALMVRNADAELWYPIERCFDGEAALVAGSDIEAGFRAFLDLAHLPVGLYSVTPVVAEAAGSWTLGEAAIFERSSPDGVAPKYLPIYKQSTPNHVERLEPLRVVRGEPIVVSGWAIEPSSSQQGQGVYARLNDYHFLPLPSALKRPDISAAHGFARDDIGFAGIVATAHLRAGAHRLDLALSDASGRGWYSISSETIEVV